MLSCPVDWCVAASEEDRHKVALQCREDLAENYTTMRYNAVQNMFDAKAHD